MSAFMAVCTPIPGHVPEGRYSHLEGLSVSHHINPYIHLDSARCGFEEFEYSQHGFSSDSPFLLHTISPLIATEIIYCHFNNDGDSQSQHSGVLIYFTHICHIREVTNRKSGSD